MVRSEQDPNNAKILDNIFRLVFTTNQARCGFLPPACHVSKRWAHAGETLMGKFRDGMPVTAEAVTLILSSIDRIKEILSGLEATEAEPEGTDQDLIVKLHEMVERGMAAMSAPVEPAALSQLQNRAPWCRRYWSGNCVPGEVSLDELERAFRERATEIASPPAAPSAPPSAPAPAPAAAPRASVTESGKAGAKKAIVDPEASDGDRRRQPVDPGECRHAGDI